jgi:hypothetical protein
MLAGDEQEWYSHSGINCLPSKTETLFPPLQTNTTNHASVGEIKVVKHFLPPFVRAFMQR